MGVEKQKVLVVDDEAGILLMLESIVQEMGHKVFLARNGLEAVKMAKEVAPDLVLMDVRMPVMNGLDALVKIREDNPEARVALMSACSFDGTEVEALQKGALACISKPFDIKCIKELF